MVNKYHRKSHKRGQVKFPSLDSITSSTVPTDVAAYHLHRKPNTLRVWHSLGKGPIRPIVIYGKLNWPVAEIRRLVGGGD